MRKNKKTALLIAAVLSVSSVLGGCNTDKTADTNAGVEETDNGDAVTEEPVEENQTYTVEQKTDGKTEFNVVTNPNGGETLSYAVSSGLALIEETDNNVTYAFKDMDGDGELDPWEDWRLDIDTRAADLATKLTKEQIAGLMLFSSHERNIEEGLTDAQKKYLEEDNLRNVLNAGGNNIEASVLWNNEMQAYVESLGGQGNAVVPVNFSTDPRSTAGSGDQYMVSGTEISLWPSNLGLAATFDIDTITKFAKISSEEYRGLGISTLLGPQIDLATEPRWLRVDGTFGESTQLTTDITKAFADGYQSTYDENDTDLGWGMDSLNVMIKHFPGDGSGEGGRESHTEAGKYAVYPGKNFTEHTKPFIDGGLNLAGNTKSAASVMSSYSIGIGDDGETVMGERAGSAYNKDKMDILRVDNNYDGVICTDWGVTTTMEEGAIVGTAWGAEGSTVGERHFDILKAGSDMYGGNNDKMPVLEAYDIWEAEFQAGNLEISAEERFQQSAKRLVKMMMQPKLFENPYLEMEESKASVASQDKVEAGYQAQLDSVVMVKNANNVIKAADVTQDYKDKVVYIASSINHEFKHVFSEGGTVVGPTMNLDTAKLYFKDVITDEEVKNDDGEVIGYKTPDLSDVDLAIIGMRSPNNGNNFSTAGLTDGTFYPLSLQYRPYTADGKNVRKESIAGNLSADGKKENRSYFGETSIIGNEYDLDACLNAVKAVEEAEKKTGKEIPVIVAMKAKNPVVMSEFESKVDAIVVGFSVSDNALLDIILGKQAPKGLLPIQFPADMDTVEAQLEDVGHDMVPYTDSEGNAYDFAYGLNYDGVISDQRTDTYKVSK